MYSLRLRSNPESGIALISVLWVLLLLSSLAATVAYIARTNAILTHRNLQRAQAEAAADAAIMETISRLSDEQVRRHPAMGGNQRWEYSGMAVDVAVTNEAGRIDVNSADSDLISAFLRSQGVNQADTARLLGELREAAGGPAVTERNGQLQSVEDLWRIPGWKAQKLDCWMDSFTVYTRLPQVDVGDASPQVLEALKWAAEHHLGGREWATSVPAASVVAQTSIIGHVMRISAFATLSDNVTAGSVWIGRLTGDRRMPMLTMRWDHAQSLARLPCSGTVANVP